MKCHSIFIHPDTIRSCSRSVMCLAHGSPLLDLKDLEKLGAPSLEKIVLALYAVIHEFSIIYVQDESAIEYIVGGINQCMIDPGEGPKRNG